MNLFPDTHDEHIEGGVFLLANGCLDISLGKLANVIRETPRRTLFERWIASARHRTDQSQRPDNFPALRMMCVIDETASFGNAPRRPSSPFVVFALLVRVLVRVMLSPLPDTLLS
jgi:hypothetical protein